MISVGKQELIVTGSQTSIKAGLHKHAYGLHTQLKVLRRDVGRISHDEGEGLHTLDEGLGVM